MATKNNPPSEVSEQTVTVENTPENTPVPGGGRYRWSIALPGWVEVDEDGNPVVTPVVTPATPTPTTLGA